MEPVTRAYYDFSPLITRELSANLAHFERADFPEPLADVWLLISQGYLIELMSRAGVKNARWTDARTRTGEAYGVPLVTLSIQLKWA